MRFDEIGCPEFTQSIDGLDHLSLLQIVKGLRSWRVIIVNDAIWLFWLLLQLRGDLCVIFKGFDGWVEEVAKEVISSLVFAQIGCVLQVIDLHTVKKPCVNILPFISDKPKLVIHDEFQKIFKYWFSNKVTSLCDLIRDDWHFFLNKLLHKLN